MVTCGGETRRYKPADLNMLNRKTKEPTLQWILFRSSIQNNGAIGWGEKGGADNLKTQKKELNGKPRKTF